MAGSLPQILYIHPVFYAEVILLRKAGLRLRRQDWPVPIYGQVFVQDHNPNQTHFRSMVIRQAVGISSVRPAAMLFDPYFLTSAEGALIVAGVELAHDAALRRLCEHGQVWLCRTRATPQRELPPVSSALENLLPEA